MTNFEMQTNRRFREEMLLTETKAILYRPCQRRRDNPIELYCAIYLNPAPTATIRARFPTPMTCSTAVTTRRL